ncbi:MAG TPA: endoribonuclease MazF, partial [Candidatus Atribacteria bacterium]|nr:endoribonuclease MazF [Candidatus Atribacteria bacterium]
MSNFIPQRGDIVWIDMQPQAGHEQSGRRPAVVLSPESYNGKVGLALLCPITRQLKGYPFEVIIPPGLKVEGVVLSDQVKSLDWKVRNAEFCDKVPDNVVLEILKKLMTLLKLA